MRKILTGLVLAVTLLASGCGGGGGLQTIDHSIFAGTYNDPTIVDDPDSSPLVIHEDGSVYAQDGTPDGTLTLTGVMQNSGQFEGTWSIFGAGVNRRATGTMNKNADGTYRFFLALYDQAGNPVTQTSTLVKE